MTRNERDEGRAHEAPDEERLRRVLEAAAATPDEVPDPSPFLMTRLRARIAGARPADAAPQRLAAVGALAWRTVPVLVLVLALLGVWTGVERSRADQAMDDEMSAILEPGDLVGEAMSDEPAEPQEGVR
jgi:hypothetical protein